MELGEEANLQVCYNWNSDKEFAQYARAVPNNYLSLFAPSLFEQIQELGRGDILPFFKLIIEKKVF